MQGHECEAANALIEIKWQIWDAIVKARKLRDEANLDHYTDLAQGYHLIAGGLTDALNIVRDYIADPELAGLA
jgi:hypothetical protein